MTDEKAAPTETPRRRFIPFVALAAIAGVGYLLWRLFFSAPAIPDSLVTLSGRMEGDDSAVAPKTSGRILEIRVREGDRVNAGDVLAALQKEGLGIVDVSTREADLEDVFLNLTRATNHNPSPSGQKL